MAKVLEIGSSHPPHHPDLAVWDGRLFRSFQKLLNGKKFQSNENIKNLLNGFLVSKYQKLGIMLLQKAKLLSE